MLERTNSQNDQPSSPPNRLIPSIQLIPDQLQPQPADLSQPRKDRKQLLPLSVNNFIQKTYSILQEKQFESIVSWSDSSDQQAGWGQGYGSNRSSKLIPPTCSFRIHNLRAFEEIVLPRYFKHSNMSSFVRQLNMYNFHKVRSDKNQIEFEHQKFIKNMPELLPQIRRKQVESSNSIPSIALIPQANSNDLLKDTDMLSFKKKPSAENREEVMKSPEKKGSSSPSQKTPEEEQKERVAELQEANRNLKKLRQQKANQLRQLVSESRTHSCDKFNKFIFALFASKINLDSKKNEDGQGSKQNRSLQKIHHIIAHLLDSSEPKKFNDYQQLSQELLRGGPSCSNGEENN